MIQVNEHVCVSKDRQAFYETNKFTDLFVLADEIAAKKDCIEKGIQQLITSQTDKVNGLVSEHDKEQWHSDTFIQLHTINQILLSVMLELNRKVA